MESEWFLRAALVLSWLSLSKAQNTPGSGVSCLRSSPADRHTLLTFLRHDAAGMRFLYLTKWSDDMRLAACEINSNPDVTEGYSAFCNRKETWDQELVQRFKISMLLSPDAPCALVPPGVPEFSGRAKNDETEKKTRRKRSWIFPGTLWCGTGSKAAGFEQLGMFEKADKCCREHDHCSNVIPALSVNYGVFNPNFFTVSHCECDQRFRQCLLGMNDSISSVVGYSFFSILKVPCFELKQQKHCTQMYWWGMCKKAREAPYAIFKSPLPYNSSDVTGKHVHIDNNNLTSSKEQHLSERPVPNPQRKASKSKHRCDLKDPPRGDTFHRRRTKGSECRRHKKLSGEGLLQMPRTSMKIYSFKSKTLKRDGKKKTRKKDFSGLAQKIDIPPNIPTTTCVQISSTAIPSSISALTRRLNLQKDLTKVKGVTKQAKSKQKAPKQSKCCGSNMAVSGDIPWLHCKSCLKPTGTPTTTVTPTKTNTDGSPVNQKRIHLKNKIGVPNQEPLATIRSAATFATPITREQKMTASFHKNGKPQKQLDFHLLWKNAGQQPLGHTTTQMIHAKNSLVKNYTTADKELQCRSLKHLDDCKFKIPPLEKKYNLTNMESKTAYHCDCTSRLAVRIQSLKEPSPPHSLLVEFVSQDCFTLLKEKKCNRTERCSGGFTKASDLHQALMKIEEKDSAAMRVSASGRKKRIPVRLYKYCLRLRMRADIMAELK